MHLKLNKILLVYIRNGVQLRCHGSFKKNCSLTAVNVALTVNFKLVGLYNKNHTFEFSRLKTYYPDTLFSLGASAISGRR